MLHSITITKLLNYQRAQKRSPFSGSRPSSTSERPWSQLGIDSALHLKEVARRIFFELSEKHQEVIELITLKGLTQADAAEVLGIAEGTVKSRHLAAKRELATGGVAPLTASQRQPL